MKIADAYIFHRLHLPPGDKLHQEITISQDENLAS